MLKSNDFENLIPDFLFTYQQILLHAYLHKNVDSETYHKNHNTWDTILRSLEAGVVLGLAKLLEEKSFLGRDFENTELNIISGKIENIRHCLVAHNDTSKIRNISSFLKDNQLTGTDLIKMIDALKSRAILYQQKFGAKVDVQAVFEDATRKTIVDLEKWLLLFKTAPTETH